MMKPSLIVKAIVPFVLLLSASACVTAPQPKIKEISNEVHLETNTEVIKHYLKNQSKNSPLELTIVLDKSLSVRDRIQQLKLDNLQPLLDLGIKTGGEISLLLVCDTSDRPAIRVTTKPPNGYFSRRFPSATASKVS